MRRQRRRRRRRRWRWRWRWRWGWWWWWWWWWRRWCQCRWCRWCRCLCWRRCRSWCQRCEYWFDVDADVDADVDLDLDVDVDAVCHKPNAMRASLYFMFVGEGLIIVVAIIEPLIMHLTGAWRLAIPCTTATAQTALEEPSQAWLEELYPDCESNLLGQ